MKLHLEFPLFLTFFGISTEESDLTTLITPSFRIHKIEKNTQFTPHFAECGVFIKTLSISTANSRGPVAGSPRGKGMDERAGGALKR